MAAEQPTLEDCALALLACGGCLSRKACPAKHPQAQAQVISPRRQTADCAAHLGACVLALLAGVDCLPLLDDQPGHHCRAGDKHHAWQHKNEQDAQDNVLGLPTEQACMTMDTDEILGPETVWHKQSYPDWRTLWASVLSPDACGSRKLPAQRGLLAQVPALFMVTARSPCMMSDAPLQTCESPPEQSVLVSLLHLARSS